MAQRVIDVRAGLPSGLPRSGNVAVTEIDIPGMPKQMAAHSQASDAGKGLVDSGNRNFVAQSVPNKAGDLVCRGIGAEYKILDSSADQLGKNTSARGTVSIHTEKSACASFLNVAEQVKAKYPNITVNIFDSQGVILHPPRKTS
ncbi:deaminase domain-containing protein [Pseudomonas sp. RIT-PI-a]|uniref:deaminase domain-containing protein n=1 Tax=Pseudomonas sp. RIT-PI-a TaxID=1681194 RepID=UPI0009E30E12